MSNPEEFRRAAEWQNNRAELRIEATGDPSSLVGTIGMEVVVAESRGDNLCDVGPHLLSDDAICPDAVEDLGRVSGVNHAVGEGSQSSV